MVLCINTKDQKLIEVVLLEENKKVDRLSDHNEFGSQVLLPLITQILEKNGVEFKYLTAIEVATGPGSFTGLRVGVSVANALGFGLGIPVNGKKMEIELQY